MKTFYILVIFMALLDRVSSRSLNSAHSSEHPMDTIYANNRVGSNHDMRHHHNGSDHESHEERQVKEVASKHPDSDFTGLCAPSPAADRSDDESTCRSRESKQQDPHYFTRRDFYMAFAMMTFFTVFSTIGTFAFLKIMEAFEATLKPEEPEDEYD